MVSTLVFMSAATTATNPDFLSRGVHPLEAMMHFPSVSDFSPISENFSDAKGFFQFHLFPKRFFDFTRQNF